MILSLIPAQGLSSTLPAINTLFNTFLLGKFLGETALAALCFVGVLSVFASGIGGSLASGAQVLCGQNLGKGNRTKLNEIFNTVIISSIAVAIILILILTLLAEPVAILLGATDSMTTVTANCIYGYALCVAFTPLYTALVTFCTFERMDVIIAISSIVMTVVNIGGNILNIFLFKYGIFGSTLATSLGTVMAVIILFIAILLKKNLFCFSSHGFSFKTVIAIIKNGSVMSVNQGCAVIKGRVVNQCMYAVGGTLGMSALAIANNISASICEMMEFGVLGADRTVASMLIAEKDTTSLKRLQKTTASATWYIYLAIYALIFFLAKPIALISGATPDNVGVYVTIIRLYNLYMIINNIFIPAFCLYQATNQIKEINVISLICNAGLCSLLCYLFAEPLGVEFISLISLLNNAFYVFAFAIVFWFKAKHPPRSIFETVYISDKFGAPKENRFKATITSIESAIDASEGVRKFCIEKGVDKKQAYYSALCIEEIAVDTVKYRFKNSKCTIDLRVIYNDGHIYVMLRDDCKHFDPVKWLELCSPKDEMRSMGIKAVSKISREMNYMNTLGLNVLAIEI